MNKIPKKIATALMVFCGGVFVDSSAIAQNAPPQETGWSTSCLSDQVCELKTEINSGGNVAARISVFNIRGMFFFQYTIPLGVDIKQGIFIKIDEEGQPITTRLSNCTGNGCTGSFELTTPVIQSMKQGNNLAILFSSPTTQDSFAITFSLSGFTANFAKIINQ
jgi:invasion protein IalB